MNSLLRLLAILWVGAPLAHGQSSSAAVPKVEDVYKNIQVFRGLPADELIPTMRYFSEALGVSCVYCHVERTDDDEKSGGEKKATAFGSKNLPAWYFEGPNRELDNKPAKQMARMMIRMVSAINKDNFGGGSVVTCYTCHQGNSRPRGIPSVFNPSEPAPTTAKPVPVSGITADQIVDKFIAAVGGSEAIGKISTRVAKGEVVYERPGNARPPRYPIEILYKAPGQRAAIIQEGNGVVFSINGNSGWHQSRNGADVRHQPRDLMPHERERNKMDDLYFLAPQLKQIVRDMRVDHQETIAGKDVYVVAGRNDVLPDVRLYFERESGLLVRVVHFTGMYVGRFPFQVDFSDFRTVGGVKIPFRWTRSEIVGEAYTYQISQVQDNVPVDESKFVRPASYLYLFRPAQK